MVNKTYYSGSGVPTSVDTSENNHNDRTQKKYTVNRTPQGGCLISRPLLIILIVIILLLLIGAIVATYFLVSMQYSDNKRQTSTTSANEIAPEQMTKERIQQLEYQRLPKNLRPIHYSIKLMPFIWEGNFTISGQVIITVNTTKDTDKITMHINDIKIDESSVKITDKQDESTIIPIKEHKYNSNQQQYTIVLDDTLKTGNNYKVDIKFTAYLSDSLLGLYRVSYVNYHARAIRWMLASQFFPTEARRAFPCFDEPTMKATFTISLAHWRNMTSRSNMRIKQVTPVSDMNDWVWDHYYETPIMSTSLIAMIVSDLQPYKYNANNGNGNTTSSFGASNNSTNRIDFAVWSRREALEQTRFAGTHGPLILEYYEHYFQIPYPLPKLDLVAVPDLGYEAMENWGLITFRESHLLYDEKSSTIHTKRKILLTISHELAHQWFGDLVSPEWWDDIWLNEGFATYIQYLGAQHAQPSLNIIDEFALEEIQTSFQDDCLIASHPIYTSIRQIDDTNQIFDNIAYRKGASIIRMLNYILGESTFKAGLIDYLNDKKYSNANHNDLWNSLAMQAKSKGVVLPKEIELKDVMDSWILQTGYPVVTVSRNYDSNSAAIIQSRFLLSKNISDSTKWWIPISYTTQSQFNFNSLKPVIWLNKKEIILENIASSEWLYLNLQQTGYYRVNYDITNWKQLIAHMQEFSHTVHAQLIDDAMNLARANLLDYDIPFSLIIESFRTPKYIPMAAALRNLGYIDNLLVTTPLYGKFKLFMSQLTRSVYEDLGFTEQSNNDYEKKMRRIEVLNWECTFENSDCIIQARQMFRDWMINEGQMVPSNLKSIVYCTAIREGGEVEWDFAYRKYLTTNIATDKPILLMSLGCASQQWLLSRYLHFLLSNNSGILKQDGEIVFSSVAKNPNGHLIAFEFLRTYWNELRDYYGDAFSILSGMVSSVPVYMNTQFELTQMISFKKEQITNYFDPLSRAFDQGIEEVRYNVDWMVKNYKKVEKWLDDIILRYRLHSYNV